MEERRGPYVALAVFCERVLREADGTLSLIRIVDRITQQISVFPPAAELPPVMISLSAVLGLKSGGARGSATVSLRPETPSGLRLPETSTTVLFEGEDRGVNVALNLTNLQLDQDGLYWFDVLINQEVITRMPLRVIRQRLTIGQVPGQQ